jgi:hypothetical protein
MRTVMGILATLMSSAAGSAALAAPHCTDAPVERWISAEDMRAKIAAADDRVDPFKTTPGNCYEIYGRNKEGKRVEIYFDPITGDPVRESIRR